MYGIKPWQLPRLTRLQVACLMRMLPYVHPWSSKFGEAPDRGPTPEQLAEKYHIKVPDAYWRSAKEEARDTIGGARRA